MYKQVHQAYRIILIYYLNFTSLLIPPSSTSTQLPPIHRLYYISYIANNKIRRLPQGPSKKITCASNAVPCHGIPHIPAHPLIQKDEEEKCIPEHPR